MGIFNPDSRFSVIMSRVFDLMLLNFMWILCCLPIITIGASTSALYYVTLKMVKNEEGGILKSFFKSFRQNFKESVPLTLLMLLFGTVMFLDFRLLSGGKVSGGNFIFGLLLVLAVIGAAVFSYTFPLLSKFENTVRGTLKNALLLSLSKLPKTLLILLLNGSCLIWILLSPGTFWNLLWFWVFIGFSLVAFLNSFLFSGIFSELIPKEEEDGENGDLGGEENRDGSEGTGRSNG